MNNEQQTNNNDDENEGSEVHEILKGLATAKTREEGRSIMLEAARKNVEEIDQYFVDLEHWNEAHPEGQIEADPGGELAKKREDSLTIIEQLQSDIVQENLSGEKPKMRKLPEVETFLSPSAEPILESLTPKTIELSLRPVVYLMAALKLDQMMMIEDEESPEKGAFNIGTIPDISRSADELAKIRLGLAPLAACIIRLEARGAEMKTRMSPNGTKVCHTTFLFRKLPEKAT